MDGLKILLLGVLVLLVSTKAQSPYEELDTKYIEHIDKALKKVNTGGLSAPAHANYYGITNKPRLTGNYHVNILLKSTNCKKEPGNYGHRKECQLLNKPIFNCVVCKTEDGELVDCRFQRDVNKGNLERAKCLPENKENKPTIIGGNSLLQKSEDNEKKHGCLGCI